MEGDEREWSLTDAQKERLGEHLETEYATLIELLGDNFHSAVIRMAVQIERIAMILSAMRGNFAECADSDYETAELIGNRLLLHMAAAYRLIDGDANTIVPEIKPLDQKAVLLKLLPDEFGHQILIKEAASQGIPSRTAERWNESWQQQGIVYRIRHDRYKKSA